MSASPIRLLASDLDGTLVAGDAPVSAGNVAAVRRAEEAGLGFALVTARPPRWLASIGAQLEHRGLALCANGAVLYDLHTEQILSASLLSAAVQAEVAAALAEQFDGLTFAVEALSGYLHEPDYPLPAGDHHPGMTMTGRSELLGVPGYKLLARHRTLRGDDYLRTAQGIGGAAVTITASANDGLLEISAPGISKASGLAMLAQRWGLDAAQVAAVGDHILN